MDKQAYSEMFGRELGTRLFLESELDALDKTASDDIDEGAVAVLGGAIDEIAYREAQQKLAFQNGAHNVLTTMESALNNGADANDLLGEIKEAKADLEKQAMAPANEDEDEAMFGRMVKGAAEQIATLTGANEITDEIKTAAVQLVASHVAPESNE